MQIKAISLFIASYLVISTVAAPTAPTPEELASAAKKFVQDSKYVLHDGVDSPLLQPIQRKKISDSSVFGGVTSVIGGVTGSATGQ
jgi:hypothetical protein